MTGYFRLSPIITAFSTKVFVFTRFSIGCGAIFFPPAVTMMSFLRSVIRRKPSASTIPMSPVWNHPSWSITSAVACDLL